MLSRVTVALFVAALIGLGVLGGRATGTSSANEACPPVSYSPLPGPTPPPEATPTPPAEIANICNSNLESEQVLHVAISTEGYPAIAYILNNAPQCDQATLTHLAGPSAVAVVWPASCVKQGDSVSLVIGYDCSWACGSLGLLCFDWLQTAGPSPCDDCASYAPECAYWGGSLDCEDGVGPENGLPLLRYIADLPSTVPETCPQVGTVTGLSMFGDLNCDGSIDPPDLLRLFRHFLQLPDPLVEGCRAMS